MLAAGKQEVKFHFQIFPLILCFRIVRSLCSRAFLMLLLFDSWSFVTICYELLIFSSFVFDIMSLLLQDLPRTFPGHPWLDTPEGHAALRRVLVGYSFRDSDVGYCQVTTLVLFPISMLSSQVSFHP